MKYLFLSFILFAANLNAQYAITTGDPIDLNITKQAVEIVDLATMNSIYYHEIPGSVRGYPAGQHIVLDLNSTPRKAYVSYVAPGLGAGFAAYDIDTPVFLYNTTFTANTLGTSGLDLTPNGRYLLFNLQQRSMIISYDLINAGFVTVVTQYSSFIFNQNYFPVKAVADNLALTYEGGSAILLGAPLPIYAIEFDPITGARYNRWPISQLGMGYGRIQSLEYANGIALSPIYHYNNVINVQHEMGLGIWIPTVGYVYSLYYFNTIPGISFVNWSTFGDLCFDPNMNVIAVTSENTTNFPFGGENYYLPLYSGWVNGPYTANNLVITDNVFHPAGIFSAYNIGQIIYGLKFNNLGGGFIDYPNVPISTKMQIIQPAATDIIGLSILNGYTGNTIGKFNILSATYTTANLSSLISLMDLKYYL